MTSQTMNMRHEAHGATALLNRPAATEVMDPDTKKHDGLHPIISILAIRSEGLGIIDRLGPDACIDRSKYNPHTQVSRPWGELATKKVDGSSITGTQTGGATQGGATGGNTTGGGYGQSQDQDQCDWSGDYANDADMDGD